MARRSLFEAMVAFITLPGIVAYAAPLWVIPHGPLVKPAGLILVTIGTGFLMWCVRDFYVAGKGTLAPWAPPSKLVRTGLYQRSRNPMYISVFLVLLGWGIAFSSTPLALYAAGIAVLFTIRVRVFEEPWLERIHGEEWVSYKTAVRRWLI